MDWDLLPVQVLDHLLQAHQQRFGHRDSVLRRVGDGPVESFAALPGDEQEGVHSHVLQRRSFPAVHKPIDLVDHLQHMSRVKARGLGGLGGEQPSVDL